MAIQVDITDDKGVKTRYHKIKKFEVDFSTSIIKITLAHYVNATLRDVEKNIVKNNEQAKAWQEKTDALQNELDELSAKYAEDITNEKLKAEVVAKSNAFNDRVLAKDILTQQEIKNTAYKDDDTIDIDYFEPLTLENIYEKLAEAVDYAGGKII